MSDDYDFSYSDDDSCGGTNEEVRALSYRCLTRF